MEEFEIYHWLIQHPFRTYVTSAILILGLGLFIVAKVTAYRDKRRSSPEKHDEDTTTANKIPRHATSGRKAKLKE